MAYLSNDEYLARATIAETVRISDESKTGTVDQAKLAKTIADTEQLINAYLNTRYELPIADPPEILLGLVFDLARERLHGMRPTQTVTDNADRARALLKDLSTGRATLPVAPGDAPPETLDTGGAVRSNDAPPRVFNAVSLNGFANLNNSTGYRSGPVCR